MFAGMVIFISEGKNENFLILKTPQEQGFLQIHLLISKEVEDQTELQETTKYQTAMETISGHVLVSSGMVIGNLFCIVVYNN